MRGHHVVVPTRPTAVRLADLTRDELTEFATTIVATMKAIRTSCDEPEELPTAFNVSIKDGVHAGAPFATLHAHVCPRRPHDLKPDEVCLLQEL